MSRAPNHNDFKKRWVEDFVPGDTWEFGAHEVTAEEIIAFGRAYDPEPFHVDPEAATRTPIGELIASGIQTAAWYRMLQCTAMSRLAFSLSPGWGAIRFHDPVRPGDVLSGRAECISVRPSASRPQFGLIEYRGELLDAAGNRKFSCEPVGLHARRDGAPMETPDG